MPTREERALMRAERSGRGTGDIPVALITEYVSAAEQASRLANETSHESYALFSALGLTEHPESANLVEPPEFFTDIVTERWERLDKLFSFPATTEGGERVHLEGSQIRGLYEMIHVNSRDIDGLKDLVPQVTPTTMLPAWEQWCENSARGNDAAENQDGNPGPVEVDWSRVTLAKFKNDGTAFDIGSSEIDVTWEPEKIDWEQGRWCVVAPTAKIEFCPLASWKPKEYYQVHESAPDKPVRGREEHLPTYALPENLYQD